MTTNKKISELAPSSGFSGVALAGAQSGDNVQVAASDLLSRTNHTGSQTASTISDFTAAVTAVVGGTGNFFDKTLDDTDDITQGAINKFTTSADITKLAGIATGATANSSDAFLLARANHTGTQLASTISNFSTAADARISAAVGVTVQAYDVDLDAWAGVNPSSYSTSATIAANYQPLDSDLTSWAGITRASGFDTFATTPSSANLRALLTDEVGTGATYFVGGALGTPASGTATNITGLPISTGVSGLGTSVATFLATPSSANLRAALTDESGTGAAYFQGGDLGTPSAGVLTSATGLPISTGVSGLGTSVATFLATPSSANLRAALTDEVGTGAAYFVGGALGTPASGTATNITGLPISTGVSGLGTGIATFLATPSSANLAAALTDETGTGAAVFAGSPALTGTPTAPTAAGGTNTTQLATTAFVAAAIGGSLVNMQTFSASGTYTPTTGATSALAIITGGGGGGGVGVNGTSSASGGGAGGTTLSYISSLGVLTVTIGGGGASNTDGSTTSLGTITALGGKHGTASGLGGAGAAATATGTLGIAGGDGGPGSTVAAALDQAGSGGASFWGSGGSGGVQTNAPRAGVAFGSGGGGGTSGASGNTGAAGAGGLVVVMEFK